MVLSRSNHAKEITSVLSDVTRLRDSRKMIPEDVFAIDPNIRWAGLATLRGHVVFCQMRRGVKSIAPEEDDRALLELRAQYLTEMTGPVTRWAGSVDYVAISYEKFIELIVILHDKYVVVTLSKDTPANRLIEIAKSIQGIGK